MDPEPSMSDFQEENCYSCGTNLHTSVSFYFCSSTCQQRWYDEEAMPVLERSPRIVGIPPGVEGVEGTDPSRGRVYIRGRGWVALADLQREYGMYDSQA